MTKEADSELGNGLGPTQEMERTSAPPKMGAMARPTAVESRGTVVVNVRFLPNGLVNAITYQPEHMSAQDWFDHLCRAAPNSYRALSGGRGAFQIDSDEFAAATQTASRSL